MLLLQLNSSTSSHLMSKSHLGTHPTIHISTSLLFYLSQLCPAGPTCTHVLLSSDVNFPPKNFNSLMSPDPVASCPTAPPLRDESTSRARTSSWSCQNATSENMSEMRGKRSAWVVVKFHFANNSTLPQTPPTPPLTRLANT